MLTPIEINPGQRRTVALLATCIAVGSCGPEREAGWAEREAAWRSVVEFVPPAEEPFWGLVDLVVDGPDIWVVDMKAARIHRFTEDGRHRLAFGVQGSGPGELKSPTALGLMGDTLWVLDAGNGRIEYFSRDGAPLRSEALPKEVVGAFHMVRFGDEFIASHLFGTAPFARIRRQAEGNEPAVPAVEFGADLIDVAETLAEGAEHVLHLFRLAVLDGELWALHSYLPLVGVFDASGTLARTITYSAPPAGSGRAGWREEDGKAVYTIQATASAAGSTAALRTGSGDVMLLSQQRDRAGRQIIFRAEPGSGTAVGVPSPFGMPLGFAVPVGDRMVALALAPETDAHHLVSVPLR